MTVYVVAISDQYYPLAGLEDAVSVHDNLDNALMDAAMRPFDAQFQTRSVTRFTPGEKPETTWLTPETG